MLQRAKDGEVGFEHLQLSNSRMHRHYRPFTEKSVILLRRILDDLTQAPISPSEMRVILKILSNQSLAELVFKSSEHVSRILSPTLKALSEDMARR
jgi:DNA-binding transcriptional MerR regulator